MSRKYENLESNEDENKRDSQEQGLRVIIIDHNKPDFKISDYNRSKLNRELLPIFYEYKEPMSKAPVYNISKETFHGHDVVVCRDLSSVEFLKKAVSKIHSYGNLEVVHQKEFTPLSWNISIPICEYMKNHSQLFFDESEIGEMIRDVLEKQNPEIPVYKWRYFEINESSEGTHHLHFAVDEQSVTILKYKNTLNLLLDEVIVKIDG